MGKRDNSVKIIRRFDLAEWAFLTKGKEFARAGVECRSDAGDKYAFVVITIRNRRETLDVAITPHTMTLTRRKIRREKGTK